jgi:hypothetical protein
LIAVCTGLIDESANTEHIACALEKFLAGFPETQHVSAHLLADKEELICRMRRMGFVITAYLPAWYQADGKRFAHGTHDLIRAFQHEFSRFYA